jgi:hypothetical protein
MQKRIVKLDYKFIIAILFIYACELLANYLIKTYTSFHSGKDGGMANAAVLHIIICYIFFLIIRPNIISLIGIGGFVGILSCVISIFFSESMNSDLFEWYNWMLLNQFIAASIAVLIGFVYWFIIKRIEV